MPQSFWAYRVEKTAEGFKRSLQTLDLDSLPPGQVLIEVNYSSLNYKDALSASGHRGVSKNFPHTPGIDAAGVVRASDDERFKIGDEVIVTSYDLGMDTPGGFGQMIRVPADWVVPLPSGLSLREAMILGTAGFTAALCVDALLVNGLEPKQGPVLVTGASGGVGSLAIALLSKLGFEVAASTGTVKAHQLLRTLGAKEIIDRHELAIPSPKPMLSARWAAAIDTVGGSTLDNIVKSLSYGASVAACGLVGGVELTLTVYPFILRGVRLLGIDSAECSMSKRQEIWRKLADPWKLDNLNELTTEINLEGLDTAIDDILQGKTLGRTLLKVSGR